MPRKAIVVLALTCGFFATAAAADNELETQFTNLFRSQDQLGDRPSNQKIIKDPAEYNAYIKALNTMDPKLRAAAMEAFIAEYPDSVVIDDALELLLAAYQATGDEQKKEETAKRILGRHHGSPQAVPRPEFAQPMTPVRTPRTIADLANLYHDKVLALRHSFKSGSQEYEADGTPVKAGEEGSWTLYGCMLVKKISVEGDRLKVEGKRPVYGLDRSGSLVRFQNDRKHRAENLKVTVLLKQPLSSAAEAAAVLARVFALTPEEMVNSVPAYWQPQVAKLVGIGVPKKASPQDDASEARTPGDAGDDKIFRLADMADRKHFAPPRILYKYEPEFSQAARDWKYSGIVGMNVIVDSTGHVGKVTLVHPVGLGLDEKAVETIRAWKFAPATHDGQPVAVAVYVEVDFHLY